MRNGDQMKSSGSPVRD